jgi:adenine-specific DNA-methyltransferase
MTGLPLRQGKTWTVTDCFAPDAEAVIAIGDCLDTLRRIPDGLIKLIITSPPYNLNKAYESPAELDRYLSGLQPVVDELMRVLSQEGSVCWQVGNYVEAGEIFPLDIIFYPFFKQHGLKLRNRIVWHFEHGLHASRRFSGRYETLLWFTKGDRYTFNLDAVRVPSKYPGKTHYKGKKRGQPSGNPLGKNPSDLWRLLANEWELGVWDIPNVKANHPEKTIHPCQFPIELAERCVLALSCEGDWVIDPFAGVGSTLVAALMNNRRGIACEQNDQYVAITRERIRELNAGTLRYRPIGKPVFQPTGREKVAQVPLEWAKGQVRE